MDIIYSLRSSQPELGDLARFPKCRRRQPVKLENHKVINALRGRAITNRRYHGILLNLCHNLQRMHLVRSFTSSRLIFIVLALCLAALAVVRNMDVNSTETSTKG
jgi:hypothetical protein